MTNIEDHSRRIAVEWITGAGGNRKQPAAKKFYKAFIIRGEWIDLAIFAYYMGQVDLTRIQNTISSPPW